MADDKPKTGVRDRLQARRAAQARAMGKSPAKDYAQFDNKDASKNSGK